MGLDKSKEYLRKNEDDKLEALFIYRGEENTIESFATKGMKGKMDE